MFAHELFKPLTQKEQVMLKPAIKRLYDNDDFRLLVRDLFTKANPLGPCFTSSQKFDPIAAARSDGERNFTRFLLDIFNRIEEPEKSVQKSLTDDEILASL